jgi:hypothetical protein
VDPSIFEKDEEKVLWDAYLEVADKIHPGTHFSSFTFAMMVCSSALAVSLCCIHPLVVDIKPLPMLLCS